MLHAWRLRMPIPTLPKPICVTTADPFPIDASCYPPPGKTGYASPRGTAGGATKPPPHPSSCEAVACEAVRVLPDEAEFFDSARILSELRPASHATAEAPGPGGLCDGAPLLSFRIFSPAGAPLATPRGLGPASAPASVPDPLSEEEEEGRTAAALVAPLRWWPRSTVSVATATAAAVLLGFSVVGFLRTARAARSAPR